MGDSSKADVEVSEKSNECLDNGSGPLENKGLEEAERIESSKKLPLGKEFVEVKNANSRESVVKRVDKGRRISGSPSSGIENKSISTPKIYSGDLDRNKGNLRGKGSTSNLPVLKSNRSGSSSSLVEKHSSPSRSTKSSNSSVSVSVSGKVVKKASVSASNPTKVVTKVPPKVPVKPKLAKTSQFEGFGKKEPEIDTKIGTEIPKRVTSGPKNAKDFVAEFNSKLLRFSRPVSDSAIRTPKREEETPDRRLQRSQSKIEKLQRDLRTKIRESTVQNWSRAIVESRSSGLLPAIFANDKLDQNENVRRDVKFNEDFAEKNNLGEKVIVEDKRTRETDFDYVSDSEETLVGSKSIEEKRYRTESVSEIEKRWSGQLSEGQFDRRSSASSKSSYVEELGSASSREVLVEGGDKSIDDIKQRSKNSSGTEISLVDVSPEDTLEETVSDLDSNSCVERKIDAKVIESNGSNGSDASTLKETSHETSTKTSKDLDVVDDADAERIESLVPDKRETLRGVGNENSHSERGDGYADFIKTFTMEAGTSRTPKEEKKRKGFRRLLPASLFSPKDSRKEYKKDQKERKKLNEKNFSQYQQNGNYTRSPDTMNLNEDIKRNVKLDTSLNGSIIEERLNEIKQELFPEQGLTTSTPDHFLRAERTSRSGNRDPRFYAADSSLSSIAPEDKWMDQNIISGSPDMRELKFKQKKNEGVRRCGLERKHSLQGAPANEGRFIRNHGPSGRTSAPPPSERFLVRPRAVHPVDRPLPAIPQKIELLADYEGHRREVGGGVRIRETKTEPESIGYPEAETPSSAYVRDTRKTDEYQNAKQLYEEGNDFNESEPNRNQSVDSGFNLTPVSAQVKITRQPVINQNQKAPLTGRSAKYSPSSSHRSGDYADSSYTPNSSQKSEFSPASSKSGEYYLNSSRTSEHTSPNDSLTEKRDQIYENNDHQSTSSSPPSKVPYPVSPNVKIQNRAEPVYDLAPVVSNEIRDSRSPEPLYVQRNSPQIPLSTNLTKLRAHVDEDSLRRRTSPVTGIEDGRGTPQRSYRAMTPNNNSNENNERREDFEVRVGSPTILDESSGSNANTTGNAASYLPRQRVTSPLTVLPLDHPKSVSYSPTRPPQPRTPTVSQPNGSRRSQPNEQILIASPKREPHYDSRIWNQGGSRFPELGYQHQVSPVPMIDAPNSSSDPSYDSNYDARQRLASVARALSPQRAITRLPSPGEKQPHPQPVEIRRPEPIYGQRIVRRDAAYYPPGRALSPTASQDSYYRSSVQQRPPPPLEYSQPNGPVNNTPSPGSRPMSPRSSNLDSAAKSVSPQRPSDYDRVGPTSTERPTSPRPLNYDISEKSRRPVSPPSSTSTNYNQLDDSSRRSVSPHSSTSSNYRQINVTGPPTRSSLSPNSQQRQPPSDYSTRSNTPNNSESHQQRSVYPPQTQSPNPDPPTRRQTMQHLEAFYWQQKAIEARKKGSSLPVPRRQTDPRLDQPEIREAMYWRQLKKMEEEQQKKIYQQQNARDERSDPRYWRRKLRSPPTSPTTTQDQQQFSSVPNSDSCANAYWRSKLRQPKPGTVTSKPPITMSQNKGQNHQPVLVVRPQPVYRAKEYSGPVRNETKREPPPRSKSASPLFARSDDRRSLGAQGNDKTDPDDGGFLRGGRERSSVAALRKTGTPPIYEDNSESDKKPPPIFKRGSLLSNSSNSVDYGTGQKRVSFSNQTNNARVGSGSEIWPTKHGMAPEPPTRQRRSDGTTSSTSDTDSVFLREAENENNTNLYGNVPSSKNTNQYQPRSVSQNRHYSTEYDADRPLPPPPRDILRLGGRNYPLGDKNINNNSTNDESNRNEPPSNPRRWPAVSESESGSEAGEIQRILRRRSEEEWNPDAKGRQSNDTGVSGRGEGEGGTGDLPGAGRRVGVGGPAIRGSGGTGGRSRDEPRRHTLSGDHQPSLHHQQFNSQLHPLHPHHLPPPHGQYGTLPNRHAATMDLEMGTKSRQRKSPLPRGYPPLSTAMLFDDDPGIMSEVETSSTGFRRGGKQRSSLPVVRTPSKTLERPLGLVFLQYRNETKRALLPNEITSIDTVKALFVRSFPKQLTMEYLDSPLVKVYIHDSNKDMFYELEDMRSHLRDIRDRSVLRLFESSDGVAGMPGPLGAPGGGGGLPPHWEDQSYFSEPEFDSEYQHQHIHKSKTAKSSTSGGGGYYMGSSTLPRSGPLLRAYSPAASSVVAGPNANATTGKNLGTPGGGGVPPAKPLRSYQCGKSPLGSLGGSARFSRDSSVSLYSIPDRLHGESGYMSSPERSGGVVTGSGRYPGGPYSAGSSYEDPYYSQYSGTVTPVIDEEASDTELLEESYNLYGVKPPGRPPSGPPRSPFPPGAPALTPGGQPYDVTRIRVEHMERQLANLTGLVQKALTHAPHATPAPRDYLQVPATRDPYRTAGAGDEFDKHSSSSSASLPDDSYLRTDVKPPKLGKDKSVSFEKSVSFSDEPPDMNSPKQHSPQHAADTKPTKPAIKSSTLPRMSSQERDRHKPAPPPKPTTLAAGQYMYRDLALTPEMYNTLRGLQKKAKDLRQEVRNIMRMSQAQALTVRETIQDTSITIRAVLLTGGEAAWANGDTEKLRLSQEEDLYKQGMLRLEKDLTELESSIEELRGNVITRKTRVNMSDVENMALILSKSSKTVADLKVRFPILQEGMKGLLSSEMEKAMREEKFLNEEPERLESALHRCKKLTGTLVTLKRLASVQEQRLPNAASVEAEETPPITPTSGQHSKTTAPVPAERGVVGSTSVVGGGSYPHESSAAYQQRPENALDALLDELQTFSRPGSQLSQTSSIAGYAPSLAEIGRSASQLSHQPSHPPLGIAEVGRKGSIDSSTSYVGPTPGHASTLRRLHSYPSSSDTDTSPPIARLQVSSSSDTSATPPQKPPVPERNAELLQLATARRVPPPPPPRTSSRSPLASPTSPQLPPRNPTGGTLRRPRGNLKESGKPPMALPSSNVPSSTSTSSGSGAEETQLPNNVLSASNSSSCESINSQEGLQNKKGRQEQLEQRHQELLRKQKALQEQYARLQQLQRNTSGLTTIPPTPPDLLKKTGSESNLLAKMGLGLSTANSGSLTSLAARNDPAAPTTTNNAPQTNQTTTNKIYETDIL